MCQQLLKLLQSRSRPEHDLERCTVQRYKSATFREHYRTPNETLSQPRKVEKNCHIVGLKRRLLPHATGQISYRRRLHVRQQFHQHWVVRRTETCHGMSQAKPLRHIVPKTRGLILPTSRPDLVGITEPRCVAITTRKEKKVLSSQRGITRANMLFPFPMTSLPACTN